MVVDCCLLGFGPLIAVDGFEAFPPRFRGPVTLRIGPAAQFGHVHLAFELVHMHQRYQLRDVQLADGVDNFLLIDFFMVDIEPLAQIGEVVALLIVLTK